MKLYNSLTRKKEVFKTLHKNKVLMYVCGITPNNATHLGHAFTYVAFDVLVRYLQYKGYRVEYLQNATDVNDSDDVIEQAKESGKSWSEIADFWIEHFQKNMTALYVLPPTYYIKASHSIEKIIKILQALIEKGFAYEKKGNVYFDTEKYKEYGQLSRYTKEQMLVISRERGNNPNDPLKKNPLDFILWLASKEEPYWKSLWSNGRPGWHIECSAMIHDTLGDQIDIHGGGHDLIFPHHESEIAQSENFTNKKPYVRYWMHTGMVLYEGEKMSKSLGNLVIVSDLLKQYSGNTIRWMLLSHRYREPWEYTDWEIKEAERKIKIVKKALKNYKAQETKVDLEEFTCCLDDDLNTPEILRTILYKAEKILQEKDKRKKIKEQAKIKEILEVLGFKL